MSKGHDQRVEFVRKQGKASVGTILERARSRGMRLTRLDINKIRYSLSLEPPPGKAGATPKLQPRLRTQPPKAPTRPGFTHRLTCARGIVGAADLTADELMTQMRALGVACTREQAHRLKYTLKHEPRGDPREPRLVAADASPRPQRIAFIEGLPDPMNMPLADVVAAASAAGIRGMDATEVSRIRYQLRGGPKRHAEAPVTEVNDSAVNDDSKAAQSEDNEPLTTQDLRNGGDDMPDGAAAVLANDNHQDDQADQDDSSEAREQLTLDQPVTEKRSWPHRPMPGAKRLFIESLPFDLAGPEAVRRAKRAGFHDTTLTTVYNARSVMRKAQRGETRKSSAAARDPLHDPLLRTSAPPLVAGRGSKKAFILAHPGIPVDDVVRLGSRSGLGITEAHVFSVRRAERLRNGLPVRKYGIGSPDREPQEPAPMPSNKPRRPAEPPPSVTSSEKALRLKSLILEVGLDVAGDVWKEFEALRSHITPPDPSKW